MPASAADIHRANGTIADPYLVLLEFWEKGDAGNKIRAVLNNEDVTSNGEVYTRSAINISHPSSSAQRPTINIGVSNVDRTIGWEVLGATRPIICRIMEINYAQPDAVLRDTFDAFYIDSPTVSAEFMQGELKPIFNFDEPWPNESVNTTFFPGL